MQLRLPNEWRRILFKCCWKKSRWITKVNAVFDPNPPKFSPKPAGKYPEPLYLSNQKGGAYSYIVNPETGRRVKLNGRIGKRVLRNYLLAQSGGDLSIFDPDMQNRQFGCKQPEWSPGLCLNSNLFINFDIFFIF